MPDLEYVSKRRANITSPSDEPGGGGEAGQLLLAHLEDTLTHRAVEHANERAHLLRQSDALRVLNGNRAIEKGGHSCGLLEGDERGASARAGGRRARGVELCARGERWGGSLDGAVKPALAAEEDHTGRSSRCFGGRGGRREGPPELVRGGGAESK